MKTFLIIDTMNLLWRAAHVTRGDNHDKVGLSLHIMFTSIMHLQKKFQVDHLVFCFEGNTWRKKYDPSYKMNRVVKDMKLSKDQAEYKEMLLAAMKDLSIFLEKETNVTMLQSSNLEADDLIAGWIQNHEEDSHIILSSDSDFIQLIAPNVSIYNGVERKIINNNGVFNEEMKPLKKNGKVIESYNPEYFLFEKIIRGDTSDNIKPAYPGVRKFGTKNKVGIVEAFADRNTQGWSWNNFMKNTFINHEGKEVLVKDKYELNKLLIDLSSQPEDIKEEIINTILEVYQKNKNIQMGFGFFKFCSKYELNKLLENSTILIDIFKKPLKG